MPNMVNSVKNVATSSVATLSETAHAVKNYMGRLVTKSTHTIKTVASKAWAAVIHFFKHFPSYIRSGYGVGAIGIAVSVGLLIGAHVGLRGDNASHRAARAVLSAVAAVVLFGAGAVMVAFGNNPVSISRVAV